MTGRPAKTLEAHCLDRTFRPSRHADLLATEPLPAGLAHFSASYRAAASDRERQAVALELRDAIDAGQGRRELTAMQFFYSGLGPAFAEWGDLEFRKRDGSIDWAGFHALERRWKWWNGRHGRFWRAKHGATTNSDLLALCKAITGTSTQRVDVAEDELREHQAELDRLVAARERLPDPPGFALVS